MSSHKRRKKKITQTKQKRGPIYLYLSPFKKEARELYKINNNNKRMEITYITLIKTTTTTTTTQYRLIINLI